MTDEAYQFAHLALVLPWAGVLLVGGLVALLMAVRGHRGASAVAAAAGLTLLAELSVVAMWQLESITGAQIDYQSAPYFAMQFVGLAVSAFGPTLLALSALWGRRDG